MTSASGPVTISITRIVSSDRAKEVAAWARAGQNLLSASPGYLGSGGARPDPDSTQWHMLFRFEDAESVATRGQSAERAWWTGSGQGLVEVCTAVKRTGIETAEWPLVGRVLATIVLVTVVLVTVVLLTPVMTYLAMPQVTRALRLGLSRRV